MRATAREFQVRCLKETHLCQCVHEAWDKMKKGIPGHTIDIAKATGFALLGVMQTTGVVDGDISFVAMETCSALHRTTSTDGTEVEETIKDRTIITNVEFGLLPLVRVHIVRGDPPEKLNVLVSVELRHFHHIRRFGALNFEFAWLEESMKVWRAPLGSICDSMTTGRRARRRPSNEPREGPPP